MYLFSFSVDNECAVIMLNTKRNTAIDSERRRRDVGASITVFI